MTKKSLISVGVIGLLSVSVLVLGGVASWADEVERMQVQIMTLDGKQLAEQEYYSTHANPLSSLNGRPLADGVYLLVVRSRDANGNVIVRVQKFTVLRGKVHASRSNADIQHDPQGQHKLQPQALSLAALASLCITGAAEATVVYAVETLLLKWEEWKFERWVGQMAIGCVFRIAFTPVGDKVVKALTPILRKAGKEILKLGFRNVKDIKFVEVVLRNYAGEIEGALRQALSW